jgi:hypothetical protein
MAMGDHPYKICFGNDSSFVAMIEYATKHSTPSLGDEYSPHAVRIQHICPVEKHARKLSKLEDVLNST